MENNEDSELSLRLAGRIKRYHTWPTIQQQTVAEHTWQVMRIWFELFGSPSSDIAIAILLHDVGELKTGDLPYRGKRENPKLKEISADIEKEHLVRMVEANCICDQKLPTISIYDSMRLKFCDLLEMGEFALDEIQLGNSGAKLIFRNVELAIEEKVDLCDGVYSQLDIDLGRVWERLKKMKRKYVKLV